jgi:hypothetical protein
MHTKFWSGNLKGRALGRCMCRWEDNIGMDLNKNMVGGCGLNLSGPGQEPMVGKEPGNEYLGSREGRKLLTS